MLSDGHVCSLSGVAFAGGLRLRYDVRSKGGQVVTTYCACELLVESSEVSFLLNDLLLGFSEDNFCLNESKSDA